jgi:hypothetical protein
MTPSEIIIADTQDVDPNEVLQGIAQAVKANKAILFHEGNSVLVAFKLDNQAVELHLFTKDSPIKLAKAILEFVKKLQSAGIKTVYGTEPPTQILQLLKNLGIEIQESDNPKFMWMSQI